MVHFRKGSLGLFWFVLVFFFICKEFKPFLKCAADLPLNQVVGHPYLAELPSRVTGRALKQFLTTLLPSSVSFDATSLVKAELLLSNTTGELLLSREFFYK